jgi:hypothetical protein
LIDWTKKEIYIQRLNIYIYIYISDVTTGKNEIIRDATAFPSPFLPKPTEEKGRVT